MTGFRPVSISSFSFISIVVVALYDWTPTHKNANSEFALPDSILFWVFLKSLISYAVIVT